MKVRRIFNLTKVLIGLSTCLATPAHAQFVGDIFATDPSVASANGQDVEFTFEVFVGNNSFGATQLSLNYDPQLLSLRQLEIDEFFDKAGGGYHRSDEETGSIQVILANTQSLERPQGIVELFTVKFNVLATQGIIPIQVDNESVLRTDSGSITGNGFDAEVVIAQSSSTGQSSKLGGSQPLIVHEGNQLHTRAKRLRREGFPVDLYMPTGKSRKVSIPVAE